MGLRWRALACSCGVLAVLLFLDFKFVHNFNKNNENVSSQIYVSRFTQHTIHFLRILARDLQSVRFHSYVYIVHSFFGFTSVLSRDIILLRYHDQRRRDIIAPRSSRKLFLLLFDIHQNWNMSTDFSKISKI
jgi:hypothetical protein